MNEWIMGCDCQVACIQMHELIVPREFEGEGCQFIRFLTNDDKKGNIVLVFTPLL